jgi:hypothetical protein
LVTWSPSDTVGHSVGTIVKKRVKHVSSAGPEHDIIYDILLPEVEKPDQSVQRGIPYRWIKLLQEAQ